MTQQKKKKIKKIKKTGKQISEGLKSCYSMSVSRIDQYQVKGLSLVPINWDTLSARKLKLKAWSNDTTENEEKENKEKKDKGYKD